MSYTIKGLRAIEILDSRGNPTVEVHLEIEGGIKTIASVPSGASTGSKEAVELRDKDSRYMGKGVKNAIDNVNNIIKHKILNRSFESQGQFDKALLDLDSTPNKSNLGANAILPTSIAFAKAIAIANDLPLYKSLGTGNAIPTPLLNVINGGAHADNELDIQEFMIIPNGFDSLSDKMRAACEVYHTLKKNLMKEGYSTNVGDEGGFAPQLKSAKDALEQICKAVRDAGYILGEQIVLGLDVAASEFYEDGKYHLKGEGLVLDYKGMSSYLETLATEYPIASIEDPMSEHDIEGWMHITRQLGGKIQIVGDDVFVTNPMLIEKGIDDGYANAVLIKPNQIGTVTECLKAIGVSHRASLKTIISHRSGETEDTFIAHLSVAVNAGQIKTGAPTRGERVAKYNELLRIEAGLI
ncbi:MAG: phosphopyruvate hydratase [Alphaproteobacteria bacterium]|jgi:enolase